MITDAGMKELAAKSIDFDCIGDFEKWIKLELKSVQRGTWRKLDLELALRVLRCSDRVQDMIERLENSTEFHGVDWDMLGREQSVDELEANNSYNCLEMNSRVPSVPFGFLNAAWESIKTSIQPGDKVHEFSSSDDSWQHLAGHSGYCLVRGNKVVSVMTLIRS